ncbi:GNAT family N-acetyltransferase [Microbacterium azadirachtae]|uniref:Mycothiol acetyltransferase n=1 Tax=Microbacterium azadirachtae TaxID=582680 RepID=A0A0F0LGP2_9MICO|nr:GNAT family N-acetyltransferase [Microbacterium azadirachtae]KJL31460.1 Mycothiol acetyltransferase [Microbacterium azadirachtae]
MELSDVAITAGIPRGQRPRVARLYWQAFHQKLRPALSDERRAIPYLESQLADDRVVCAHADGTVIGAVGFALRGRAAVGFSFAELRARYSTFTAPVRALLLGVLERRAHPGSLLLDGISVAPEARGLGVGTALLAHVRRLARDERMDAVRLSVVDTNPRARDLYQRLGYVAEGSASIGPLRRLYGFRTATEMVLSLEGKRS